MDHSLSLQLPQDVYTSLARAASEAGETPEKVAVRWLTRQSQNAAKNPLDDWIGAFDTSGSNWAEKHDEYLGQGIYQSMKSDYQSDE